MKKNTPKKLVSLLTEKIVEGKPVYVAGIRLGTNDVKFLLSEIQDGQLLSELKAFNGTVKEFIQQQLITQRPEIVKESRPLVITHNLRGRSLNSYIKEFEQIDASRIRQSVNQVAVNHVILSWAQTDAGKITDAMLKDMAMEYIRLRGENNLYVIVKHEDQLHTHLHVTVSGTQLNGLSSRISKKEFAEIKQGMDLFQKTHFPVLVSLPNHGKVDKEKASDANSKNIKNAERLSEKNILLGLLETAYSKAGSVDQFLSEMRAKGHEPYFRNGRVQGILYEGGRKFRLKPLGYDEEKLKALDLQKTREEKTLNDLRELRAIRSTEVVRNIGDSIIEIETKNVTNRNEETELQEIEDIRNGKNDRDLDNDLDEDTSRDISDAPDNSEPDDADEKDLDEKEQADDDETDPMPDDSEDTDDDEP